MNPKDSCHLLEAMYPVDLPDVDDMDLTYAAEQYISSVASGRHNDEWVELTHTSKVAITSNNVRHLKLFEDEQLDCAVVALNPPDDPTKVLALHLHDKWWSVDDILRTSNKSRSGLVLVQSIIERVIVFLLSQVVERSLKEKQQFSLHPHTETIKLLWRDGQAVGFYTIKHKGSLCDRWTSHCYMLSVLDTVLVRSSWRRRGLGLQMLDDFCRSFSTDEFLGVSSPLSSSMVAVCRSFLQQHEEHRERLYEVEAPGGWTQRRNIWLNIQLGRYFPGGCKQQDLTIQAKDTPQECSPSTLVSNLDSGSPARPPQSLNTKQVQKFKPPLCTQSHKEKREAEESHRDVKQIKRTKV